MAFTRHQSPQETINKKTTPTFPSRAVVTAGMPYGNKGLHFGHIGGVFVPADFYARFLRDLLGPENVLFVSGTDCYGSPILEGYRKEQETGFSGNLTQYITNNHIKQREALKSFAISCDIFSGSALEPAASIHQALSDKVVQALYDKKCLQKRSTLQFYDTEAHTFLNGRQVQGFCPIRGCKSEKAYADECDLGHQFDPQDLIKPISQLSGTTPELRPVENWYFDLPACENYLQGLDDAWEADNQIRSVVTKTLEEWLVPPLLYIKNELREDVEELQADLPHCTIHDASGGAQSFSVEFKTWHDRDAARTILEQHTIRYRAGKCLLPFRITGNIDWGVKAPALDGSEGLTIWCWPESLWAPISFSQTVLEKAPEVAAQGDTLNTDNPIDADHRFSSTDWRDWWCGDDEAIFALDPERAKEQRNSTRNDSKELPPEAATLQAQTRTQVFQFIGQDNIYFYCITQPAIWHALQWNLFPDTPVANYHLLFMNKKASSSGTIKPPAAEELLDAYTAEALRYHWLSFALSEKPASFAPKVFDTSVSAIDKKTGKEVLAKDDPRVADPALKENAFLANVFNRLARSCFYGTQNALEGRAPQKEPSKDLQELGASTAFEYLCAMHDVNLHTALAIAEEFGREANKRWDAGSKAARNAEDYAGYEQALADAFYALHILALCFHGATPLGCEMIREYTGISREAFWNWDNVTCSITQLLEKDGKDSTTHVFKILPPKTDFFTKA